MVAFLLLSLLMVMMFFIYRTGASAWKKSEAQMRLLQDAQVFTTRLSREAERGAHASVSLDPGPTAGTALSFLTCWNATTQQYEYDASARSPVWQKHLLLYYDSAAKEVLLREIPLAPVSTTAVPLAPLSGFRSGGRTLARNITNCSFSVQDRLLELQLTLELKRYGSPKLEQVQLPTRVFLRN